ncbi:penicillin-binding protein 2 [Litorilinea aerophila]|uniref:Penicillin-binding protein 2 n=1 Tax=Litorilinea aerophila TaxID=1204385 RepID=A0A540VGF8_9CHLR|nr:penicillin-binding protein 2 [Litorilinea aerophila]MCC9076540.1 penicillin-binding protein 2 [Litorilinea aerophila]
MESPGTFHRLSGGLSPHLASSHAGAASQPARPVGRFHLLAVGFGLLTLIVLGQLVRYQIFQRDQAAASVVAEEGPTARGIMVDRDGVPLVVNRYFYQISATPRQLETEEARIEVARQLHDLIGLPYDHTMSVLTNYQDAYFAVLANDVSLTEAQKILDFKALQEKENVIYPLQQVHVRPTPRRFYPQESLFAHLTGFVRPDLGGVMGLEAYYDEFLRQDGAGLLGGRQDGLESLPEEVRRFVPSDVGKDLVLTLDRTVQWIIRDELAQGLAQYRAEAGTIIVMAPKTGAILGMVNLPDYDPNRYPEMPQERFPNPAISAQYEPGSIFKIITMAAALDAGLMEPSTVFTDTGYITVGGRAIYNSNRMAYGQVTATDALARSLNVVTAQVAQLLGPDRFYQYLRLFGFGEATNIDLSGEINGLIKTPQDPHWSLSDLGTNSFGQGLAVTPIQMIRAAAAIANQGRLMQPYVVQARVDGETVQWTEPVTVRQVLQPEAAQKLTEMMVAVVETGNTKARVPGYRVAGKSGTAQIPTPQGYVLDETIVSFIGFAPADDPQLVVLVKMDRPDPNINQWASNTAAPVFSRVMKRLLEHMNIPPESVQPVSLD